MEGLVLVKRCHFNAQPPTAGMNNKPECTVLSLIHFDKMVATAQCAHSTKSLIFLDMMQTEQFVQICLFREMMRCSAHLFSGWNLIVNQFVQLLQLQPLCMKLDCQHPAANVHAYQTGSHTVLDGHCGADSATFSGMNIRHNADAAAL